MKNRACLFVGLLFLIFGHWRATKTVLQLTETVDEYGHLGNGIKLLMGSQIRKYAEHPPIARLVAAFPLYAEHLKAGNVFPLKNGALLKAHRFKIAEKSLGKGQDKARRLGNARLAATSFYCLGGIATLIFFAFKFGAPTALIASIFYSLSPEILAHSSLVTTDMPGLVGLLLGLIAWIFFLRQPSTARTVLLGFATAFAFQTKYSNFLFLLGTFGITGSLSIYHGQNRLKTLLGRTGLALLMSFLLISFFELLIPGYKDHSIPALYFLRGLVMMFGHNHNGHPNFFWGKLSETGHLLYFPVSLALKTPLPTLFFGLPGLFFLLREGFREKAPEKYVWPLAGVTILAAGVSSDINIGIRHVIGFSLMLLIGAGYALSKERLQFFAPLAIAWLIAININTHPHYLSYFNPVAGKTPEKYIVDSNLDWGQGGVQVAQYFQERGIDKFELLEGKKSDCQVHSGWIAVHISSLKYRPECYTWLHDSAFVERLSGGTYIYHLG